MANLIAARVTINMVGARAGETVHVDPAGDGIDALFQRGYLVALEPPPAAGAAPVEDAPTSSQEPPGADETADAAASTPGA